jgi:hypothetical protein
MTQLIEALTIFRKYKDLKYPTHCEDDVLIIMGIDRDEVSPEDQARLKELGFFYNEEGEGWESFRYGSAL